MKAHELLSDESKWTIGYYARDNKGRQVYSGSIEAVCWCAEGALFRCYESDADEKLVELEEKVGENNVPNWNDRSTYQEVYNTLKELDI